MKDEVVILRAPQSADPDGSRLRGAIEAHFAWERARGVRDMVVYLLAALSVPVWLTAVRPHWLPIEIKDLSLALWAVSFMGLLMAAWAEWRWQRQRSAFVGRTSTSAAPSPRDQGEFAPETAPHHPDP